MAVSKQACLTIVSKNYLSAARVLCDSFLEHHPNAEFYVALADEIDGYFDLAEERFKLLSLAEINLPQADIFPYQYNILELNTAIKPFALAYLLEHTDVNEICYIDPDIWIHRPLDEVWNALKKHSIVLTPHMRAPFDDGASPSEVQILQSGTYNLGFIGLRNNATAKELLRWWAEKMYLGCVVDIPEGLFVDQKWMDLVPGYVGDTYILRDPSYNVAYWNLHERHVSQKNGKYLVENLPLAFFHFSGYDPQQPNKLSKHQSRHGLNVLPVVKRLCDEYGTLRCKADHKQTKRWPYAFRALPNGVPLNNIIHYVIRRCLENGIKFPSPVAEPDEFCAFLMTPNHSVFGHDVAPIISGLTKYRSDVGAHFPNALSDKHDPGIREWLISTGAAEENLSMLYERYGHCLEQESVIPRARRCIDGRKDLQKAYPRVFVDDRDSEEFGLWIRLYGVHEEQFSERDAVQFNNARNGAYKVYGLYFSRRDLQESFPLPVTKSTLPRFVNWLLTNACPNKLLTPDEVYWFREVATLDPEHFVTQFILYSSWLHSQIPAASALFEYQILEQWLSAQGLKLSVSVPRSLYFRAGALPPLAQLEGTYAASPTLNRMFPFAFDNKHEFRKLAAYVYETYQEKLCTETKQASSWLVELMNAACTYEPVEQGINVAGYHNAPTGMGESARSMIRTLTAADIPFNEVILPSIHVDTALISEQRRTNPVFGWHNPAFRTSVIIANGDDFPSVRDYLPPAFWSGRRNIGYWVWETEKLPEHYEDTYGLDEIWTPSQYSADAIASTVDLPVKVVPHTIDSASIEVAKPNRKTFEIPEDQVAFGFFFDLKSVIERKNPSALIAAFKQAFGNGREAVLVLKVNDSDHDRFALDRLKAEAKEINVIWIEDTLTSTDTFTLMRSLDVYASLHRSEGFGLTLAEAMWMGKPVVATGYSGNLEFMDERNSLLVDHQVIETDKQYGPYPVGTRWAEPNIEHAADLMVSLINPHARNKIGLSAHKSIQKTLSEHSLGQYVKRVLDSRRDQSDELFIRRIANA